MVDRVARFISLPTLCAMLCIAAFVLPSSGSAQQTRQPELQKFYGELALIETADDPIRAGIAIAQPRLALLTPPLGQARRTTSHSASPAESAAREKTELDKVKAARIRLATGVPLLAIGAGGLAAAVKFGGCRADSDGDVQDSAAVGTLALGSAFSAVGVGLSTSGIISLVRASKQSRAAAKTKKTRRGNAWATVGTTLGGALVMALIATVEMNWRCIENT